VGTDFPQGEGMWRKRSLATVTLVALGVAGALGGGASIVAASADASSASNHVTITYWYDSELASQGNFEPTVIKNFEKTHPDITVNALALSVLPQMEEKLPVALSSGTGPDLVYADITPAYLGDYVKAGEILPLAQAYKTYHWSSRVGAAGIPAVSYLGSVYGVPNEEQDLGLMYNKVIFKKLGLKPPTTFAALVADMATIKSKSSYVPMNMGCGSDGNGNCIHMMHALAYSVLPTKDVLNTTVTGTGSYATAGWVKILTIFQQWAKAGYFTSGANGITYTEAPAQFCAGKAAMFTEGSWLFSAIDQCQASSGGKLEYADIPFPMENTSLPFQAYVGYGKGWFVPKYVAKDPAVEKASLELLDYLLTPANATAQVKTAELFPPVPFDHGAAKLTASEQEMLAIASKAGANGGHVDVGYYDTPQEQSTFSDKLEALISGSTTPTQAAAAIESALKAGQKAWRGKG
jgi:raffinose/stachyose/melibiose transport system substrate-binding protein